MTYEIQTTVPIEEQVSARLQEIAIANEKPVRIGFTPEAYQKAREEANPHFNSAQYVIGSDAPPTYMGLPYSIMGWRDDSVQVWITTEEEIIRNRPPPPTEAQLAKTVLESCISGLGYWEDVDDEGPVMEEILKRELHQELTVNGKRYRIRVEVL